MENQYRYNSSPAKDIFKGAVIGALVATAFALLSNKDTRKKITKGVQDAIHDMKKRAEETREDVKENVKEKYEKTARQMEDKFPKRETTVED